MRAATRPGRRFGRAVGALMLLGVQSLSGVAAPRGAAVQAVDTRVRPASEEDWGTEYLDAIMAAKLVDGVDGAIAFAAEDGGATDVTGLDVMPASDAFEGERATFHQLGSL